MLNGQTKMVSNEVNHQSSTSVVTKPAAASTANSTNEQQSSPQGQNANNRAQDDARVGYGYQRQNDAEYPPFPKSRWFGAEEPNLINVSGWRLF